MIVRRGITRTVWLIGRWAVKFPSLRGGYAGGFRGRLWAVTRGIQANLSEAEWSTMADDYHLCPVRWSLLGGIVNVYPRCDPLPVDQYLRLPETTVPFGDDKPDNWGLLTDEHGTRRPVRVDYDVSYNGCRHDIGGVNATLRERRRDAAA